MVPYLATEGSQKISDGRRRSSVALERGGTYPLDLRLGRLGVGPGDVFYESDELLRLLKGSIVEAKWEFVDVKA